MSSSTHWEDATSDTVYRVPDDVVDLTFKVRCRHLPADHAHALRTALEQVLPWLADEPLVGMHTLHGADSGNGWKRPEGDDAVIHLPKRARLGLRLPQHRIEEAMQLEGRTLDIGGYECVIQESKLRPLSTHATLFARHLAPANEDEATFLDNAARMLAELDIKPLKMMGGLARKIHTPQGNIATRSLMIDGLKPPESVRVQQHGLGERRELGCGIFIPHKSIDAVHKKPDRQQL